MTLRNQKRLAARIMKCGVTRVWIDPTRIKDAQEAITGQDIRRLINDGIIKKLPKQGLSSYRKNASSSDLKMYWFPAKWTQPLMQKP